MTRVRVKFCGLTRIEDAHAAVKVGCDAIGFVLTKRSKRFVDPSLAREMRNALPPFVSTVALFSDDEEQWVKESIRDVQPTFLQFHGSESRNYCESFGVPYIKSIAMADGGGIDQAIAEHPNAIALLFDSHRSGENGGSGLVFDWNTMPNRLPKPVILAGGLTCDNVARAVRTVRPYAVDVSSGIESAPGIKDAELMRRFINEVKRGSGDS